MFNIYSPIAIKQDYINNKELKEVKTKNEVKKLVEIEELMQIDNTESDINMTYNNEFKTYPLYPIKKQSNTMDKMKVSLTRSNSWSF